MKLLILITVLLLAGCGKAKPETSAQSGFIDNFNSAAQQCTSVGGTEWMFTSVTCDLAVGKHCITATTIDGVIPVNLCQQDLLPH